MSNETDNWILVESDGAIGRFTINRPEKRNAMTFEMWRRMGEAFEAFAADDGVRVIIVRGAGDKCFCAGNDISEFKTHRSTPENIAEYTRVTEHAYHAMRTIAKPTIARIEGFCVGGGLEVAQLCDIQVAAEGATFGVTPARLGLGYKLHDVQLLTDNISAKHAKELLITGRLVSAADALRMGLINQLVPAADLDAVVQELADTIAGNAPLSVKAAKLIVHEAVKEDGVRDEGLCQQLIDDCHASDDYVEGQRAFAEKRKPNFKGH